MLYEGIERHAGLFAEQTELRVQENRNRRVSLLNGDVQSNGAGSKGGVSARVYKDGVWGFASFPDRDDASIARAVESATLNARFLAGREKRDTGPLPAARASAAHDLSTRKPRLSQRDLVDFARAIDARLASRRADLLTRTVVLSSLDMEKVLLTSEGSVAYSLVPRTILVLVGSLPSPVGGTVEFFDVLGGMGQFEDVFLDPASLHGDIDDFLERLGKKADGVYAEAGLKDAVLGPDLAGILAHEAIGHTVEADLVLGGSVAADFMGRKVASELVTLVDFAHTALGKTCPVPTWVDDEGVESRDAVLIDRGVLRSYMHNRESAARFGVAPTGNARAYEFSDEPLIRMRNTAIMPGTSRLADMIASIDDGYWFVRPNNGQADSTSEFMFGVVEGYEIKKGKVGRALLDTTVAGVAFDMLKTVSAVSDDMSWTCGGMCGKKQLIPVGMGGPAVRCQINVGGR
jgi:TldD protein